MNHAELARLTTGEICPKCQKLLKRGPREKTITAANLMSAIRAGLIPPCPRCGRAGFIEDEFMVIIGVCPECSGAGHALKSLRIADGIADEKRGRLPTHHDTTI